MKPFHESLTDCASPRSRIDCADCPAQSVCHDDSIKGQVMRVLAERHPAIVQSMRVEALLGAARISTATS